MKTELCRFRCLPTEKQTWEQAAGRKGFSAWARLHLNEAARREQTVAAPQASLYDVPDHPTFDDAWAQDDE